ncbi:MAG: hypothetical protein ACLUKN_17035 [Bacilli bacterium]
MASYGYHELGIETTVEILGQESGYEVFKRYYKAMVILTDAKAFLGYRRIYATDFPKPKASNALPRTGRRNKENIKFLDKQKMKLQN